MQGEHGRGTVMAIAIVHGTVMTGCPGGGNYMYNVVYRAICVARVEVTYGGLKCRLLLRRY